MIKFGIKPPLPIWYGKNFFECILKSPFMSRRFWILHRGSIFLLIFLNVAFVHTFYHNTPIYREIRLQFLQFTEIYYINSIPFCFGRHTKAVLRHPGYLSARLALVRLQNGFICLSEPCYMKKFWKASVSAASKIGLKA